MGAMALIVAGIGVAVDEVPAFQDPTGKFGMAERDARINHGHDHARAAGRDIPRRRCAEQLGRVHQEGIVIVRIGRRQAGAGDAVALDIAHIGPARQGCHGFRQLRLRGSNQIGIIGDLGLDRDAESAQECGRFGRRDAAAKADQGLARLVGRPARIGARIGCSLDRLVQRDRRAHFVSHQEGRHLPLSLAIGRAHRHHAAPRLQPTDHPVALRIGHRGAEPGCARFDALRALRIVVDLHLDAGDAALAQALHAVAVAIVEIGADQGEQRTDAEIYPL